jgi:aminoglycoside 2''-phosphotransferase
MSEDFPAYLQRIKSVFQSQIESYVIHDGGDDFLVIEVNSAWMFRFPRNAASRKALEKEMKFLSKFKDFSPLKIPDYQYAGDNFAGYEKIQGSQLTEELFQSLSKSMQNEIAKKIGMFLSALHNFPIEEAAELGILEAWGGLHYKNGAVFLERVAPLLSPSVRKKSTRCMNDLLAEKFDSKVIHGDFYFPDHLFFDESQSELGVIDFGDATVYDPAHDFQAVIEIGGEEFYESVLQHYPGENDPGLFMRSNARLIARPLFVAGYVFANGLEEQYLSRLELIEALFS